MRFSSIEPIDYIALFGAKGYEIKPGIQFAGGIRRGVIERGDRATLNFILQNALDTSVEVEIVISLPSSRMFKKTHLSTISPVKVSLGATEVEEIAIPIQTALETPEGNYEIGIHVSGSGGAGGKRVRGVKQGAKGSYAKAAAKSVAASAAMSAIGLFFGGVGVGIYSPTDRMKVNMKVNGTKDSPSSQALEVHRVKLWTTLHNVLYPQVRTYLQEMLKKYARDSYIRNYCATTFSNMYKQLFESHSFKISQEELFWLGRLMSYLVLEKGGFFKFNIGVALLDRIVERAQTNEDFRKKTLPELLDFQKDVLDFWLQEINKEDNLEWLFSSFVASHMLLKFKGKFAKTEISRMHKDTQDYIASSFSAYKEGKDDKSVLITAVGEALKMGVIVADELFERREETLKRLESLKGVLPERHDMAEGQRRTIIEYVKEKKKRL